MTVRVLTSFREPSPTTNPYITQLYRVLRSTPGLAVRSFSWRTALLTRWDVFHAHWPETTFSSPSRLRRLAKQALFALLLLKMRLTGVAVVWTFHNVATHETQDRLTAALLSGLRRSTARYVVLNGFSKVPGNRPASLIPHGHYIAWFADEVKSPPVPGRLGCFGLIRPYKGIEDLLEAFKGLDGSDVSLVIGGKPADPDTAGRLRRLGDADPRVGLTLRFLDDSELVTLVTESQLMVFPYLAMHNSGAVLAALSLDRPVLVPRNEVNEALAGEVGERWVQLFDGPLTTEVLQRALAATRQGVETAGPELTDRGWADAGQRHAQVYRLALADARRR